MNRLQQLHTSKIIARLNTHQNPLFKYTKKNLPFVEFYMPKFILYINKIGLAIKKYDYKQDWSVLFLKVIQLEFWVIRNMHYHHIEVLKLKNLPHWFSIYTFCTESILLFINKWKIMLNDVKYSDMSCEWMMIWTGI